ncbi:hypothetical protein FACS1894191_0210 [Clostridia bacterium]|nr:hypothetical protein FACS1894191_0210 [Clostridia bacterium]
MDASWNGDTATKINLGGASAAVEGTGAKSDKNIVTITASGTYVVSGSLHDGQIVIAATKDDAVQLVLNGAEITNKSGAGIYASQCDELTITLAEGTKNTVTDGGSNFTYANATDEEPNAAVFSKDDLTINGTGSLTVNAGFNNGIGTKDDLVIASGAFIVSAANHGIRGNDSVTILGGDFTVTAGNDGIQTNEGEDAEKGSIMIEGGSFTITAGHDGIQSENDLLISGGEFDVRAGGSAAAAQTDTTSDSYKGIKAAGDMEITAGTFVVDSADDSIHSNGNISIQGGAFILASGDDGIHADGSLHVSGGNVKVTRSYEGLEGANIDISAGTVSVAAADDGINAAGGADANTGGGRFGADTFAAGGSYSIKITGGEVVVYSGSDGLDSNGTLEVTGGTVAVFINAPRDGETTDVDRGGTIQPALYVSSALKAGTKIAVGDIWSTTTEADATSFCLMLPGVVNGQSYRITANGSELAAVTATTAVQGMMGGGNSGFAAGGGNAGGRTGSKPGRGTAPGTQY